LKSSDHWFLNITAYRGEFDGPLRTAEDPTMVHPRSLWIAILLLVFGIGSGCSPESATTTASCADVARGERRLEDYLAALDGTEPVDNQTALTSLAEFADHLYCLDRDGLAEWDRTLAERAAAVLESKPRDCREFSKLWNPALLVVDHLQIYGESALVDVVARDPKSSRSCLEQPVAAGTMWLDDFGAGSLVDLSEPDLIARVHGVLAKPELLGLGLCSLAEHALLPMATGCDRGFDRRLCSADAQEDLAQATTNRLLDAGAAEYRAESFRFDLPDGRSIAGHRGSLHQPESFFGTSMGLFFSGDRPMMQSFCGSSGDGGGGGIQDALFEREACRFRQLLSLVDPRSLLERQPIFVCDRRHWEPGLQLMIDPPVLNRDPRCWAGQDTGGDRDDDEPDDDDLEVVMGPARFEPERVNAGDAKRFWEAVRQTARDNGLDDPGPRTQEDFRRAAAAANRAIDNAEYHNDRGDYEQAALDVAIGATDPERVKIAGSDGMTRSGPDGHEIHIYDDGTPRTAATGRHEMHHVMARELDTPRDRVATPGGRTEVLEHAAMRRNGVYRPAPGSPGERACNETGAERRAREMYECLKAIEVEERTDAGPLAPYIYVLDPPPLLASCDVFYDPASGYTDPSPIDDGFTPGPRGATYNDPRVGAIDPCPPDVDCGGVSARLPEGYDRGALDELLRRLREGRNPEPGEPAPRPPRVLGLGIEPSVEAR